MQAIRAITIILRLTLLVITTLNIPYDDHINNVQQSETQYHNNCQHNETKHVNTLHLAEK
jgi:hypothetical protein